MTYKCFECKEWVRLRVLSAETLSAAHQLAGSARDGLRLLNPSEIVCEDCAPYEGYDLDLDEFADLLDDIGTNQGPRIPEYYRDEFPEECDNPARLSRLLLNY